MIQKKLNVFWFRRDLRLDDNHALFEALNNDLPVLPIFIFDDEILNQLPIDDHRVTFIYDSLKKLDDELKKQGSSLLIKRGDVENVWQSLVEEYEISKVFYNKDYEPKTIKRDQHVTKLLKEIGIDCLGYKDHLIFEESEILKQDGNPYTVYTPYKNKWLTELQTIPEYQSDNQLEKLYKINLDFPTIDFLGFVRSTISIRPYDLKIVSNYDQTRDIPSLPTSDLAPYLRFGNVSTRKLVKWAKIKNKVFFSELIWREFFSQILFHFPKVVSSNFKPKYDGIPWRNNEIEFQKWCEGKTGYPIVDAGMRQLNQTGYMHNRVRMIVASFLCKHLLIDWRWGEAYFAQKLFDFELASNNGNWQWVAGTGCDAAPYFRVFNSTAQQEKFDKKFDYVKNWIPEYREGYLPQIVEHKFARERYLAAMKEALN